MELKCHSRIDSANLEREANQLAAKILKENSVFNEIAGPKQEWQADYNATLSHLNQIRGRNLYYPYLSTGRGFGPFVELGDGSVKIDLINGIGVNLFGHCHPEMLKASIIGASKDVVMQGNLQPSIEYGKLLEKLISAAGRKSKLKRGWIATCGTIANENAIKIARQKNSPARKIIAMENNFAGRSTLLAEITDNPEYKVGLPKYDEILYLPFYDKANSKIIEQATAKLKQFIAENPKNIAALVTELVQGEGGFNIASHQYAKALFEICKENHIAVWVDEVQTFARTGDLFAFEKLEVGEWVDIATVAKTIQCGATLYTEEYNPKPGLIAGTFTSGTSSLTAGLETLKILLNDNGKEQILGSGGKVEKIHKEFTSMLNDLKSGSCKGLISEIDGIGLMVSMIPYDGAKEKTTALLTRLFQNGVIAFYCGHGPYKLRFLLPLCLDTSHIQTIKKVMEKSLIEGKG